MMDATSMYAHFILRLSFQEPNAFSQTTPFVLWHMKVRGSGGCAVHCAFIVLNLPMTRTNAQSAAAESAVYC